LSALDVSLPSALRMSDHAAAARPVAEARALHVRGLTHAYGGAPAVEDVSFDVPAGEIVALLGPSGCGKSTVLRAIAGLIRPKQGSISLGGVDLAPIPGRARGFGMVFQSYALFPHMTVAENIAYALACRRVPRAQRRARVAELVALLRLDGLAGRLPRELSGGQQQRVAVGRALAAQPSLLLLDEPFGALDRALRLDLQIELLKLQKQLRITTLIVTHDQEEAQTLATRLVLMNRGHVEQIGAPADVYDNPRTLFANRFIGHVSQISGVVTQVTDTASTIRLSTGELLTVRRALKFIAGAAVIVTVRPEHVALAPEGGEGCLHARALVAVALGPTLVHDLCLSDGTPIRAVAARNGDAATPRATDSVRIRLDADRCQVFPADNTSA
jgi:putative spermidine/putrescine transport system ATP-binding protein